MIIHHKQQLQKQKKQYYNQILKYMKPHDYKKVMRGHIGRKQFNKEKDRKDKYKNLINSGEIQGAFNRRENRRIKATTIQSAIRNKTAKMKKKAASQNFNPEEYQKLLRKKLNASQIKISDMDTRSKLPQSSKDEIIKQENKRISRIDKLIFKNLIQEEQEQGQKQKHKNK